MTDDLEFGTVRMAYGRRYLGGLGVHDFGLSPEWRSTLLQCDREFTHSILHIYIRLNSLMYMFDGIGRIGETDVCSHGFRKEFSFNEWPPPSLQCSEMPNLVSLLA